MVFDENKHIPFIKIEQNNNDFYLTKLKLSFLEKHVDFHYREPFSEATENRVDQEKYTKELNKIGLEATSKEEGIQRRLQLNRVNEISKKFIEDYDSLLLPNSIILACNTTEERLEEILQSNISSEYNSIGKFKFKDNDRFIIIDGQHRVASLLRAFKVNNTDFELPVSLFFNVSLSVATSIFIDINGNQKRVDRSLIYDLYNNMDEEDYHEDRSYSEIVHALNNRDDSPLKNQIKILGRGPGSVSQSFLIDNIKKAVRKLEKSGYYIEQNTLFKELYLFFRAIQYNFKNLWPRCYENKKKNRDYKSTALLKTNGFGSLLKLFPDVYIYSKNHSTEYKTLLKPLQKFKWEEVSGTGAQKQDEIYRNLKQIIRSEYPTFE